LRSSVIENWLMSKSNGRGPGWMAALNGTRVQVTWSLP
jgi:hypothetical protein